MLWLVTAITFGLWLVGALADFGGDFIDLLLEYLPFSSDAWQRKGIILNNLQKYQEALRLQPEQITALCKCSDLSCRIGNRQTNKEKKIDYLP